MCVNSLFLHLRMSYESLTNVWVFLFHRLSYVFTISWLSLPLSCLHTCEFRSFTYGFLTGVLRMVFPSNHLSYVLTSSWLFLQLNCLRVYVNSVSSLVAVLRISYERLMNVRVFLNDHLSYVFKISCLCLPLNCLHAWIPCSFTCSCLTDVLRVSYECPNISNRRVGITSISHLSFLRIHWDITALAFLHLQLYGLLRMSRSYVPVTVHPWSRQHERATHLRSCCMRDEFHYATGSIVTQHFPFAYFQRSYDRLGHHRTPLFTYVRAVKPGTEWMGGGKVRKVECL